MNKELINQILEMSRQTSMGELSPWFTAQLNKQVEDEVFQDEADIQRLRGETIKWLSDYREQTGVSTVVLGMSGGVDSALTAALFKEAGWTVKGFALPIHQDPVETERGIEACKALDIEYEVIDLSDMYDNAVEQLVKFDHNIKAGEKASKIRLGNIRARLRMVTLYNMASMNGGVVASTDNLSELQAGFWTLHGDVGDVSPIQGFNKSWEVPMLAKLSGVPEATWRAKPTDGLGIDAGDEAQLGCTYLEWDIMSQALHFAVLYNEFEETPSEANIVELLNFDGDEHAMNVFKAVWTRRKASWFKRVNPVNFEHPDRYTISDSTSVDIELFQPEVIRDAH